MSPTTLRTSLLAALFCLLPLGALAAPRWRKPASPTRPAARSRCAPIRARWCW
nr:hypothetical protein [Aquitalea magnusonii]